MKRNGKRTFLPYYIYYEDRKQSTLRTIKNSTLQREIAQTIETNVAASSKSGPTQIRDDTFNVI